jgi:hypothetical protein
MAPLDSSKLRSSTAYANSKCNITTWAAISNQPESPKGSGLRRASSVLQPFFAESTLAAQHRQTLT